MTDRQRASRRAATSIIGVSIGIAAQHAGMHPQTLREYERQGLLQPHRTPGGTRRYRDTELARLRRIQALTELGMSLAAVRYVLDVEDALATARARVAELERQFGVTPSREPGAEIIRRSVSVELVHVPRTPRSPRWRNND